MPSFNIPLSGLNADSTALNTIANNLSNMNTTGFKAQTTNFSDLFYQQTGANGSGDEIQVGTGVQVASNSTDFTGGSAFLPTRRSTARVSLYWITAEVNCIPATAPSKPVAVARWRVPTAWQSWAMEQRTVW